MTYLNILAKKVGDLLNNQSQITKSHISQFRTLFGCQGHQSTCHFVQSGFGEFFRNILHIQQNDFHSTSSFIHYYESIPQDDSSIDVLETGKNLFNNIFSFIFVLRNVGSQAVQ